MDRMIELPDHRPMTRSFRAQLLKEAQANGAVTKNAPTAAAPKPVARKPGPRPEQAAAINANRKRVVNTLTSLLSHRSKEACGLNRRPGEVVEDIDKLDGDNELAVVDFIDNIYTYYTSAQHQSRPIDYMGSQPEIKPKMRTMLVDWLVEVAHKINLMPESLYLAIYILDRFLSLQVVPRQELQLVGIAAMFIACKYEEIWAPKVNDFVKIAEYTQQQILGMEKTILDRMSWNLTVPTPYVFLVRFAKAAGSDKELEHMVFFFAEMALMEYGLVSLCPSLVAASAVYAARCTLNKSPIWTETLKDHTGFNEQQLMEHAKVLLASHAAAPQSKLKAVYSKYSTDQFAFVALQRPVVAAQCLA